MLVPASLIADPGASWSVPVKVRRSKLANKIIPVHHRFPPEVYYGADPEIFLAQGDKIIGAERVIPEEGIKTQDSYGREVSTVLDGVQAELHPSPAGCRAQLASSITALMKSLKERLDLHKGIAISFEGIVTVPKEELDRLSEKAKVLGCGASSNAYGNGVQAKLCKIDASRYRTRSAGGHIHIGLPRRALTEAQREKYNAAAKVYGEALIKWQEGYNKWHKEVYTPIYYRKFYTNHEAALKGKESPQYRSITLSDKLPEYPPRPPSPVESSFGDPDYQIYPPELLAKLMDIMVGIPSVLLDRNPLAAERRKLYGRAGEYRTPPHGFEYRTLSNYWLRAYPLMSLVFGLTRQALALPYFDAKEGGVNRWSLKLLTGIDLNQVQKAINKNDQDLAFKIWSSSIRPFIVENYQETPDFTQAGDWAGWSLDPRNIEDFDFFLEKGLDHWFKEDPLTHWCNLPDGHRKGWESFLINTVRRARQEAKKGAEITDPAQRVIDKLEASK
jgi:hypothetical protein